MLKIKYLDSDESVEIKDGEYIMTATRGPDDTVNSVFKTLGAAVIREYIEGFAYGEMNSLYELWRMTGFVNEDELFEDLISGVSKHYAEHMYEAFNVLVENCTNVPEKSFLEALRDMWSVLNATWMAIHTEKLKDIILDLLYWMREFDEKGGM